MPRVTRSDLDPIFRAPKTLRAAEEVLNGAVVAGDIETGAQTPLLGANKPGTVGAGPVGWIPVVIEGVEYLMPLWQRDT